MSLYTLDERLKTVEEQVEAFLSIIEMNTRLTSDGTEYVPISLPDGTEYKMLLTTAFKKPFYEKTANYELVTADKNSVIVMDGNSLTLTIPDSLGWNKGDSCIAIVYGTGFTLANGGSVTVNSPQSFTDVNKSLYFIHKTETDEFSVVQLGQAGGGGSGTVTSVEQTVPTGFTVSGTPITSSGTLVISYDTGYQGYTTAEASKLSGIETGANVTDATNVDAAGAVMNSDTSTASMSFVIDEDTMSSDSATKVPTQQSVKAYVDSKREEDIVATVNYSTTSGATALDMSTTTEYWRLMTGNSTFSFTNTPNNGEGFIRTLYIKGAYTINDFTALGWEEEEGSEAYDGSVWNRFTIRFSKWGDGTSKVYFVNQLMPT